MSFPLDYDSACDTCTRAAVCVFIFKSFAVLSVKSRTLPVKGDLWGKRKSLFSFFVLGVCCWTLVLLLFVVFLSFLETGWHACSWSWPQTHSVANNDLLRLEYMHAPTPYWKLCLLNDLSCMWKLSSHPSWEDESHHCLFVVVVSLPSHSPPNPDLPLTCAVYVSFWNSWIWV